MQRKKRDKFLYLKLLGILIIPLCIIIAYSFYDKEFSIGEFVFQKTGISKHFKTDTESKPKPDSIKTSEVPVTDTDSIEVVKQDEVICDTTSQRILIFGDSMIEGLSRRLRQYAFENNHDVLNVIWYSSSTKIWAQYEDTLTYYLKQFEPTYIMISLGGNELFVRDLDSRDKYIKTILQKVDTIPYIWIGPPNWKEDTGINELIEQNVGTHRYFPSKDLLFERKKDGAHPTYNSASNWMDSVAAWITNSSKYRIKMNFPEANAERAGKVVLLQPLK